MVDYAKKLIQYGLNGNIKIGKSLAEISSEIGDEMVLGFDNTPSKGYYYKNMELIFSSGKLVSVNFDIDSIIKRENLMKSSVVNILEQFNNCGVDWEISKEYTLDKVLTIKSSGDIYFSFDLEDNALLDSVFA